jgi:hypothetical protein
MGRKKKETKADGTEEEIELTSNLIRVSTALSGEKYHGVIEVADNAVVDFRPAVEGEEYALSLPNFCAIEFRKLIVQKKDGEFKHMHEWNDGLIESDDLIPYL